MEDHRDSSRNPREFSNAFVSITTEGTAIDVAMSGASFVTDLSVPLSGSSSTGRHVSMLSSPIARAVSRKERPFSSFLWGDEYVSQASQSPSFDLPFEHRMIRGVSLAMPPTPTWISEGGRVHGKVSSKRDSRPLPRDGVSVRKRRESMARAVSQSPVLTFTQPSVSPGEHSLIVYRNAIRADLHGLYVMLSSMETRRLDVTSDDFAAFHSWLSVFGDFVRLYLCATERFLLQAIDELTDMELRNELSAERRRRVKVKIVNDLEQIEAIKRRSEAQPENEDDLVTELIRLVDSFSMRLLAYLSAEEEQLASILTTNFHRGNVISILDSVLEYILMCASGPLLYVILSRGSSEHVSNQRRWLKAGLQRLYQNKRFVSASVVCSRWIRRFEDSHSEFVTGFEEARREYIEFYS